MSKVVKGVKKVFKKVFKVVKKIAAPALAVAAIVFTGGAALGIGALQGGWGAIASTIGGKLGGGLLSKVVTGAITQAGYGAAIGGVTNAIMGGSFSEGAKAGAIAGAVTGGITGGVQHFMPSTPPAGTAPAGTAPASTAPGASVPSGGPGVPTALPPSTVPTAAPTMAPRGGLFRAGGWFERNQDMVGKVVSGVGQGLMAGSAADSEADLLRERYRLTAANYEGVDPGQGYRGLMSPSRAQVEPTGAQPPPPQYNPRRSYGSFEYQYDSSQGRIIRVPMET